MAKKPPPKQTEKDEERESKKVEPPRGIVADYLESFVVTLIMALFGMTFVIQAVTVPTGSMQNTILIGDYLLVNKFIFTSGGDPLPFLPQRDIERGDVIVFKYPGEHDNVEKTEDRGGRPYQINFVKRVIGLPGDKIEIKGTEVYVNDELLPEHRVIGFLPTDDAALETQQFEERKEGETYDVYYREEMLRGQNRMEPYVFGAEGEPTVVPEGHYFVLGDSRNYSLDSRYWGFVPRELVVGRAMVVYWSCDRAASRGSLIGCITNPRLDRIGKLIR
ncbi:MAG: signal peptidase I [Acidobacteria bacterium]|nr:MAG: signal peptidase I [Acidobacteriota bacterium]REK03943.1 MAG: signal peptidase I [Acidobacteriota bacterium]REK15105.1 MAG: signal peptidase I [Acidobacteriota bacterium]REK46195.1 MAG: signal peptidase I [Acidobacteriota bacterium]